jgi:protein tyrosine/serine phosphatase
MPAGAGSIRPGADRVIPVLGSHNLRDLGGLRTADGALVRSGRVFRSDYPAFADLDGGRPVAALGLATVVDLRRGREAAEECVRWADHGVTHLRCPLVAGAEDSWHARYQAYLTHRPETVVAAVRAVLDPARQPVLFHCAAGKDRTGVLAALLLQVLGVPDEAVIADYVLTADVLEPIMSRLQAIELYAQMLGTSPLEAQRPRAEHMTAFLGWLADQGGVVRWLVEHGVSPAEIDGFREAMTGSL